MATLKIKALTAFMHGRLYLERGDTETVEASEARELAAAGLVSLPDTAPAETAPAETAPAEAPTEENLDDLVGGEKMADEVENKMAPAPTNKKAR